MALPTSGNQTWHWLISVCGTLNIPAPLCADTWLHSHPHSSARCSRSVCQQTLPWLWASSSEGLFQHQDDSQEKGRWCHLCSLLTFSLSARCHLTGYKFYLGITCSVIVIYIILLASNWFTFRIVLKMSRASCHLPASFVVLRKLILMEMSHILRACFTHYLVKAETDNEKMYLGRITRPWT